MNLLIEKGSIYLWSSYLTMGRDEYYLASRSSVQPNSEAAGTVSLTADRHYFCALPPRLSIKPDGQCHVRSGSNSSLWDLRNDRRIPITKHDGRHLFTVGVNNPTVFEPFTSKSKKGIHNINLEVPEPGEEWQNFRIVGFVKQPENVTGLKWNDGSGERDISATDLIPTDVGASKPVPVYSKQGRVAEPGLFVGINAGHDWPAPFILHLVFRKWTDFTSNGGYTGGIQIMGAFDSEAREHEDMQMLTIVAPSKAPLARVIRDRLFNIWDRLRQAWDEAVQRS